VWIPTVTIVSRPPTMMDFNMKELRLCGCIVWTRLAKIRELECGGECGIAVIYSVCGYPLPRARQ
jgi:hypothetical protein